GDGADAVEFLISTNPGEPPKPISKIASGGELSRIMLAIKNVLADKDDIDTLIFDEIDTGVSGRAAHKIGVKLKETSRSRQVICITHLAQIAANADSHLLIRKQVSGGRTFTTVTPLSYDERVRELAVINGGDEITDTMLATAKELLSAAGIREQA
ncbi:MAG: DNA repair protein RecN, partial [Clostridia bacterium]|nr:DNA repair protein RecN [Clostridia bacterium]